MCGTSLAAPLGGKIWIVALIQIALSASFMLAFHFPTFLIVVFGTVILIATALSARMKARPLPPPVQQRPIAKPVLFRITVLGSLLFGLVFVSSALFGFVIFMDSWTRWHQYEGQPYHQTEFEVVQTYWQPHRKGSPSVYARGNVEGAREWMGLRSYLDHVPRSEAELDSLVPPGTTIPIYLFPELKGQARVVVIGNLPPAEEARLQAIKAAKYGLLGLAVSGLALFLLSRVRQFCYAEPSVQALSAGAGGA